MLEFQTKKVRHATIHGLTPKVSPKDNDDEIINLFQEIYSGEGEPVFSKRIQTVLDMRNSLGPIPRDQRILSRPGLEEFFNGITYGDFETRNNMIRDAYKLYAYTQTEIAAFLDISWSAVSEVVCNTK